MFFLGMKIKMRQLAQDDSGVAMVLSLMFSLFIFLMFLAIFTLGQNIQRKISLQTAVDNVAYAGALAEADTLSKLAVVNRAIAWTYVMNNRRHVDYVMQRFGMDILRAFWFDSTEAAIQQSNRCISVSAGGACPWHNAGYYCNDTDMAMNTYADSIIEMDIPLAPPRKKPFFEKDLRDYNNRTFFTNPTYIENVTLADIVNHIPNVKDCGATWDINVHNYESLISSLSQAGANNPVTVFNLMTLQNFFDDTDLGQLMHATLDLYAAQHSWYDRLEGFFEKANGMEDRQYGVGKAIDTSLYWAGPTDLDHNLLTAEPLPLGTYTSWIRHGSVRSNTNDFDIRNLFYLIYNENNRKSYKTLEAEIIQGSKNLEALNIAAETLANSMDLKIYNAMDTVARQYRDNGMTFDMIIGGRKYTQAPLMNESGIASECFYIADEELFFRSAMNGSTIEYDSNGNPVKFTYDASIPRRTYRDASDQMDLDADGWYACQSWWTPQRLTTSNSAMPRKFANDNLGFYRKLDSSTLTSGSWSSYAYIWQCFGGRHVQTPIAKRISDRDANSVRAGYYPNTVNPHSIPPEKRTDYENDDIQIMTEAQYIASKIGYWNADAYANANRRRLVSNPDEAPAAYIAQGFQPIFNPWTGKLTFGADAWTTYNIAWAMAYTVLCAEYNTLYQRYRKEYYNVYLPPLQREKNRIANHNNAIDAYNAEVDRLQQVYESWFTTFPKHYGSVTTPWKDWENTNGLCNYNQSAQARPLHANHRLFAIFGSVVVRGNQLVTNPFDNIGIFSQAFKGTKTIWTMAAARAGYRLPERWRARLNSTRPYGVEYYKAAEQASAGTYQSLWNEPDFVATTGYEIDWNLMADDWDVVMLPLNKAWKVALVNNGTGVWNAASAEDDFALSTNTGDHYVKSDLIDILKEITGQDNQNTLQEIIKYVLH